MTSLARTLPLVRLFSVPEWLGSVCLSVMGIGQSLVKYGRAQVKLATLQEDFAAALASGYVANIEKSMEEMAEYQAQRKKLDSRR